MHLSRKMLMPQNNTITLFLNSTVSGHKWLPVMADFSAVVFRFLIFFSSEKYGKHDML